MVRLLLGRRRVVLAIILAAAAPSAAGCRSESGTSEGGPTDRGTAAPPGPSALAAVPVPAALRPAAANPNPLNLPPREPDLAVGARVFAVPEAMLRGAKLGSTLVLHAAKVAGRDADMLLLETRQGAPYRLHRGYVVPEPTGVRRPNAGEPVIAEWAGVLRHGVLRQWKRDRPLVRFFDTSDTGDRYVDDAILFRATDGFQPGNFAAVREGDELRHVMLVSPQEGEPRRWLVLAHAGAAMLVDEVRLSAIPVRWEPKDGASVLAESLGVMRPGVVKGLDRPGLATVKFDRAGRPSVVGWGFSMPPQSSGR